MSESGTDQRGILTRQQRQLLFCGSRNASEAPDDEMYRQIRDRLAISTVDFQALFCSLPDKYIQTAFDDESSQLTAAPFHDALVFLFYSMLQTDRQLATHIERALRHAYAAMDQHASPRVDIVTEPFLPPQQRLEAVAADGIERVSMDALERLYHDEAVPPEAFEDIDDESELLPSADEIRKIRTAVTDLERVPLSVVLDVDVSTANSSTGRTGQ